MDTTVKDTPHKDGAQMELLQQGTNGLENRFTIIQKIIVVCVGRSQVLFKT